MNSFLSGLVSCLHAVLISLRVDLPPLCIINNFKGTKAAKLGPPLSSVMTNELPLHLCISLALLWSYPREQATAVPSHEQVSPSRWQGNRMEIETIGFYLSWFKPHTLHFLNLKADASIYSFSRALRNYQWYMCVGFVPLLCLSQVEY